jgi:hypothetical protein
MAFDRAINKYVYLTLDELIELAQQTKLAAIDIMAIQAIIRGAQSADPRSIEYVLYSTRRRLTKIKKLKDEKKKPGAPEAPNLPGPDDMDGDE